MINIILNTTNNDETSSEIVSRLLIPFQDKNILIGPGEVLDHISIQNGTGVECIYTSTRCKDIYNSLFYLARNPGDNVIIVCDQNEETIGLLKTIFDKFDTFLKRNSKISISIIINVDEMDSDLSAMLIRSKSSKYNRYTRAYSTVNDASPDLKPLTIEESLDMFCNVSSYSRPIVAMV